MSEKDTRPPVPIDIGMTKLVRWRVGHCAKNSKCTEEDFVIGALTISGVENPRTKAGPYTPTELRVEVPADLADALRKNAASMGVSLEEFARMAVESDYAIEGTDCTLPGDESVVSEDERISVSVEKSTTDRVAHGAWQCDCSWGDMAMLLVADLVTSPEFMSRERQTAPREQLRLHGGLAERARAEAARLGMSLEQVVLEALRNDEAIRRIGKESKHSIAEWLERLQR